MDSPTTRFYSQVMSEMASGKINVGLEALAYVQSDCDPTKTKTRYVCLRAEQLQREADAKVIARREQEQTERMAVWHQHRYKVTRRRSAPAAGASRQNEIRIRRSYPGLNALLSWVMR